MPQELDKLRIQTAYSNIEGSLLPGFPDGLLDIFLGTQYHVFDTGGLNTPIRDKFL